MNTTCLLFKTTRLPPNIYKRAAMALSTKNTSGTGEKESSAIKESEKTATKLKHLQAILSNMKTSAYDEYMSKISKFGNSEMFNYATDKRCSDNELETNRLKIWDQLQEYDTKNAEIRLPTNGFEEAILLTEQGRLWRYPIDNEQGLDKEREVPFEDHVFLDHLLEDFPKNEHVQMVMQLIVAGLGKNHWITVERKHEIIQFYKEYFEEKRDLYKQSGFDI